MKNYTKPALMLVITIACSAAFLISFKPQRSLVTNLLPIQKCLIISDIHFNPIYGFTEKDTVLKNKLANSSYDEWVKYFEATPAQMKLDGTLMLKDSNYALLLSAMTNMKKRLPHPAFIVIAGDFIWHGAIPADSLLKKRTIQFITRLFKQYFPGSLIVPAMGNNDTYGQDYDLQDPKFLKDFATAWEPNLPSNAADSLKRHGYYTCETGNLKFVVLNSAPLNAGTHYPQGSVMLNWLKNTLAGSNGKNIWLIMHIPPGMNSYDQKDFWKPEYRDEFIDEIIKNEKNVRVCIASHTHFDDFKVFYNNSAGHTPVSLLRIVPSICPNHGNYPSFDVAEINTNDQLVNETNWYLNLSKMKQGIGPEKIVWVDSISLKKDFGLKNIDAASFSQFMAAIKSDPSGQALKSYAFVTSLGSPVGALALNKSTYERYLKADSLKEK